MMYQPEWGEEALGPNLEGKNEKWSGRLEKGPFKAIMVRFGGGEKEEEALESGGKGGDRHV